MTANNVPAPLRVRIPENLPEQQDAMVQGAQEALARTAGPALARALGIERPPYNLIPCDVLDAATLARIIRQWPEQPQPALVVAPHVAPARAERLREAGIPFIDAAGNAYLEAGTIYVFVIGRNPLPGTATAAPKKIRAFAGTGLQVLFALLCAPEYATKPYREIARAAGVALGTVGWVLADLKALGYLRAPVRGDKTLRRREELHEQWVTQYLRQFRPRLKTRRFRAANPDWWQDVDIRDYGACWGGDVAAAKLTGHLKPMQITVWHHGDPAPLLQAQRMRADPAGDVELIEAFWHFGQDAETAPPLLVYADLLGTGDPRAIEAAKLIQEMHLVRAD
ncbi:MAG: hypothetical protein FJY34_09875 [Betaproteobacteria bacterium]|nr:hypothetical protein [Betaproteobacteria bacterium]